MTRDNLALDSLYRKVPCRQRQINQLAMLLSPDVSLRPPAILINGIRSSGKSHTLRSFLEDRRLQYSWVDCERCVTTRILLQKALRLIRQNSGREISRSAPTIKAGEVVGFDVICENFTAFVAGLEQFQRAADYHEGHILVLDRLDQLKENPAELYACFSRIPEMTSALDNLTVVMIISSLEPKNIITRAIPLVKFDPYRVEDVAMILRHFPPVDVTAAGPEGAAFWQQMCRTLLDATGVYLGSDVRLARDVARRLWGRLLPKIAGGAGLPLRHTPSFLEVYRQHRGLFVAETQAGDSLLDAEANSAFHRDPGAVSDVPSNAGFSSEVPPSQPRRHDLPVQSKYILCAAYLASYSPPKFDLALFSRAKTLRLRRETLRRRGVVVDPRALAPAAFDMERMLAILHVIVGASEAAPQFTPNVDVSVQIATLVSLRLLTKTQHSDPFGPKTRWKLHMTWEQIEAMARDIGLDIAMYFE